MRSKVCVIGIVMAGSLLIGCGRVETFGSGVSDAKPIEVSEILGNPSSHNGDNVRISGRISEECPSGCWFKVEDGSGVIHVDIAPEGLAIPPRIGRDVEVEGSVFVNGNRTILLGKGVKIR